MSSLNRRFVRRSFKASPLPRLAVLRECTIPCQNEGVPPVARTVARSLTTSTQSPQVLGIVDNVASEFVMVKALNNASIGALVVFQNGAYGIVTEIRKNGACRVSLLNGMVIPTETAVVEQPSIQISPSSSYFGRVVNVLGEPMDGLGPIQRSSLESGYETVYTNASPSITDRRHPSGALATGIKAVDAFRPVLHGQSVLILGEKGTGKRTFMRTVLKNLAKHNNNQLLVNERLGVDTAPPLRFVYVFVGQSERYIQEQLVQMRLDNVLPYTSVVAAPSSTPPANQYLAPYTGMAIANHFRERGEHVAVFVDSLSAAATASRKMSGFAFSKLNIPQSGLASILDKCGTALAKRPNTSATRVADSVGSITMFATYDMPVFSAAAGYSEKDRYTRMDGNFLRSLADNVFVTDAKELKKGNFYGFPYRHLVTGDGGSGIHTKQGPGLHHVATRGKLVLLEAEEAARNAEESLELGIEPTADKDIILDMHKKAKLLLYPTMTELNELQQLQVRNQEKVLESMPDSMPESMGSDFMSSNSSALSGTIPKRGFRTLNSTGRISHLHNKRTSGGAFFSSKKDDDDVLSRFSKKLSPAQMQALMSVRGNRRPSAAARVAAANLKSNMKQSTDQESSSDAKQLGKEGAPAPTAEGKVEGTKSTKSGPTGFDFSGLYGGADKPSRRFSTLSSADRSPSNSIPGSYARSFSLFSKIKENLTSRVLDDSHTTKTSREAESSVPDEDISVAEELDTTNHNVNIPRKRLAFRPPEGRIAQPQLFQSVCTVPLSQLEDLDLDQLDDQGPSSVDGAQTDDMLELMASLELPTSGWVAEPFHGDAQRIFLDLFLLSHTYVAPVPLARIYEYEKGLYDLLSSLPSTRSLYTAVKRRQKEKSAELLTHTEQNNKESSLSDGKIPLSRYFSLLKRFEDETLPYYEQEKACGASKGPWDPLSGLMTLPFSTLRTDYSDGTLLDAVLTNPIPEKETNVVNHDVATMIRIANNKVLQRVSLEARRERLKQKIADAKAAVMARQEENEKKKKRWFSLPPLKPGHEEELLNKAVSDAEREYEESLKDGGDSVFGPNAPEGLQGIGGHLRLSPATDFHDLPPDWQVLHVVVAEYTRRFCGLPRL